MKRREVAQHMPTDKFPRFLFTLTLHPSCIGVPSRYIGLFILQLLPSLLIGKKFASFLYFGLLAVSTVYLGAKRQDIPDVRYVMSWESS